jgi:hypothetical protein
MDEALFERVRKGELSECRLLLAAEFGCKPAQSVLGDRTFSKRDLSEILLPCANSNNNYSVVIGEEFAVLVRGYDYDDPAMCEVDRGKECATVSISDLARVLYGSILDGCAEADISAEWKSSGERRGEHWSYPVDAVVTFESPHCLVVVERKTPVFVSIKTDVSNGKFKCDWYWRTPLR